MTFEECQQRGRARHIAFVTSIQNILQEALRQHDLTAYAVMFPTEPIYTMAFAAAAMALAAAAMLRVKEEAA